MKFELDRYLSRIKISKPKPSVEGLAQIQGAQLNAIAFENVDAFLSSIPDLEPSALIEKILDKGRGGYCFELNGLLGLALQALGFDFEPILARVRMGRSEGGPRHHLAYLVKAGGESWLVDAGFGGPAPLQPLRLVNDQEQQQEHETFRIRHESDSGDRVVEKRLNGDWFSLYSFDRAAVRRCDLDAANRLCATWSESLLAQNLLLCRYTDFGRIQLFNNSFSEFRADDQISRLIETIDELSALIRDNFGITVSDSELSGIANRLGLA
ncbi:arylamine N-acetyltransferase [Methylomonas sp. LL1]|uniref:arylamine N-acetyltransferase family protein n=1 Tax=Methylomonas sp. LL1 TaxID=2785785 RepID=UPI0018C39850|nr:arylamine N-acetyltransferase [Methylomonas sp. LL1]QPK64972.1 arylamine N-acetyltransferase [Methylomonas sp. LL1]